MGQNNTTRHNNITTPVFDWGKNKSSLPQLTLSQTSIHVTFVNMTHKGITKGFYFDLARGGKCLVHMPVDGLCFSPASQSCYQSFPCSYSDHHNSFKMTD